MEPFNQSLVSGSGVPTHTQSASTISDFDTEVANNTTVAANTSKLSGIEAGAEVNNISDANATDLTDGGDSSLHYHSADRNRANHTGTQTLSTISDAGTIASQDANSVNITGGSVTGITDLAIADGGTGAGTASGARTNLDVYSTDEVDEYLAPKATAGGVRFDGANGYFDLSQNYTAFQQKDRVLTYAFNLKAEQQTFRQYIYYTGEGISNFTSGIQIYIQENSDDIRFILRQTTLYSSHYLVQFSGVIDGNDNHFVFSLDYTGTDPVITGFKNGQSLSGSVVISKTGTFDDSIAARDTVAFSNDLDGTIRDAAIFNRALSASEVADLYRNGLAGIADADRWGESGSTGFEDGVRTLATQTPFFNDIKTAAYGGTHSNYDGVTDADSIGGANTGSYCAKIVTTTNHGFSINTNDQADTTFEVELYYYIKTGQPDLTVLANGTMELAPQSNILEGNLTTKDAWTKLKFKCKTGIGNTGYVLVRINAGTVYIDDLVITALGAIAAYPMDEGIGYQLHDISSNHYDGLLSTSGFTHLVPKTEGYIRFSNLNIASTTVDLLAAGRDILPEPVVLRDAIFYENNPVTLFLSQLTLKRNNGGSFNGNHIYTDAVNVNLYASAGAIPLFATQQTFNTRRIQLGSTNSSATDISGVINYQYIAI